MDDVIQKILLEGDGEIVRALHTIGEEGSRVFEALERASAGGAGSMEALGTAVGGILTIMSTATAALIGFVEAQDSATQTAGFLAQAFGTTTAQLEGLEAGFAAAGVSAQTFERFAQRLTNTIAQQWPQITAAVRTSTTQQSEAHNAVIGSLQRVADAEHALQMEASETGAKLTSAYLSSASASLSLETAQEKLNTLMGNPPTAAQKQALALSEAQLAVKKAHNALYEASLASEKAEQEAVEAHAKAELALSEAHDRAEGAAEKEYQQSLTNLPKIAGALKGVIAGNEDLAKTVDLSAVSVQKLEQGLILAASTGDKEPSGIQTLTAASDLLSSATAKLIPEQTQLALVMRLGGQQMRSTGASAGEMLHVLQSGKAAFDDYAKAAESSFSASAEGKDNVEAYRQAFEKFSYTVSIANRDLAAMASPALTSFLSLLADSIKNTDGLLHNIIAAFEQLGRAVSTVIGGIVSGFQAASEALGLDKWQLLKIAILGVIAVVALFATPFLAIPAYITAIVVGAGLLYDEFFKVGQAIGAMWLRVKDSSVGQFISKIIDGMSQIVQLAAKLLGIKGGGSDGRSADVKKADAARDTQSNAKEPDNAGITSHSDDAGEGLDKVATSADKAASALDKIVSGKSSSSSSSSSSGGRYTSDGGSNTSGSWLGGLIRRFAEGGGAVHGAGSGTSDSILARLSNGEFVVRAAAVRAYGANFLHAINSMSFPGFAMGGLVPSPVRLAGSGGAGQASSTVNLSIDGHSFNGFRGPKNVVDELTSYAIGRQTSAAGTNPSWLK
jgi:hypothetical protein